MVMEASLDALVQAASGWEGVRLEVDRAEDDLAGNQTGGDAFGWFADRAGIPAAHDKFIADMLDALAGGMKALNAMAASLRDTAKDFGETDLDVRDEFHNLDGTPR